MRHSRVWIFACAALAVSAAPTAAAPAESPAPPPLPPGPEWRESVAYAVPNDAVAACLRAAGPGRLALFGGTAGGQSTIDLVDVGADGFRAGLPTRFRRLAGCPEVAGSDPAEPPVLAALTLAGSGRRTRIVRQVAAAGGQPQALVRSRDSSTATLATAPGGAAAIAWSEQPPGDAHSQLLVATRPPGATRFGRPRLVATRIDDWESPALAVDRRGRAQVAWVEKPRREHGQSWLYVAGSDRTGRFGDPQRLGVTFGFLGSSSLAVAPNGRALLVDPSTGYGRAWEQRPGGRRFEPVPLPDIAAEEPVVALTDAGAAVLAYRDDGGVTVLRRPAGGRFGAWQELRPVDEQEGDGVQLFGVGQSKAPSDPRATELRVALSDSGEIVVAWTTATAGGVPGAAQVAHGTLAGGMSAPRRLGGSCRAASGTTPLELADGRLAVAWSDNARAGIVSDVDWPIGGGQVHVALPAAPGSEPAAPAPRPRVTASVLGDAQLESGQSLRLRVDCGGLPCDVRASAHARRVGPRGIWPLSGPLTSAATTTIAAGGSAELELEPLSRTAFVPPGRVRDVPIELSVCTPGGAVAERTTMRARLRGRPLPPAPRIVALRAERRERRVVVTWRTTAAPERGSLFSVIGTAPPIADRPGSESAGQASFAVRGVRRRFRAVIEPEEGRLPRTVVVILSTAKVDNAAQARVLVR